MAHVVCRILAAGACYLEALAVFRADPQLAGELAAIVDDGGEGDRHSTATAGGVPRSWCAPRLLASGGLTGTFAVPGHPESLPTLRSRFLRQAKAFGLADLDAAAIRDSRPRADQAISAWVYTLSPEQDAPLTGSKFVSRHGDNLTLWGLYERDTARPARPAITPITGQSR